MWTISRTYGPDEPTLARRAWVAVMAAGAVLAVAAAVVLVVTHDPDQLVLKAKEGGGYRRAGYTILLLELFCCSLYLLVSALALLGLARVRPRDLAAAYAAANAIALVFVVPWAVGPWLVGAERYGAGQRATVLAAGWLALAATVATVYWVRQRRYDAGGSPRRSALAAIAEALNTNVER